MLRFSYQLARGAEGDDAAAERCLEFPACAPCPTFPDCDPVVFFKNCYQPVEEGVFTTGTAFVMKGGVDLQVPGASRPGVTGEPFDCETWQLGDGPGRLVLGLADFDDTVALDTAAALRLSDR